MTINDLMWMVDALLLAFLFGDKLHALGERIGYWLGMKLARFLIWFASE